MNAQVLRRTGIVLAFASGLWLARSLLFAMQTSDSDGSPLQAPVLVAGWTTVLLLATSLAIGARGESARFEALWRGASMNLALAPHALLVLGLTSFLFVTPADLWESVRDPLGDPWRAALGVLIGCWILAPLLAVLAAAARRARAAVRVRPAPTPLTVAAFLGPWVLGAAAWSAFHIAERAVLARHVEASADAAQLARWRPMAWLHAWPELWEATDHDASPTTPPPDERERRAREAFEALTGFDFFESARRESETGMETTGR